MNKSTLRKFVEEMAAEHGEMIRNGWNSDELWAHHKKRAEIYFTEILVDALADHAYRSDDIKVTFEEIIPGHFTVKVKDVTIFEFEVNIRCTREVPHDESNYGS